MSRHNNVNPDHYKVAGRERPGEGIRHERNKREMKLQERALERQKKGAASRKSPGTPGREK